MCLVDIGKCMGYGSCFGVGSVGLRLSRDPIKARLDSQSEKFNGFVLDSQSDNFVGRDLILL